MDRVEKYNRNLYERLSKNSEIKDFINKHGLSEDYVIGHINLFNACYESLSLCRDCDGLASCKQKRKGEVMSLAYDGTVYQELSYCDKKRKQMDDSRILSHFIYSDIPVALCGIEGVVVVIKNGRALIMKKGKSSLVRDVVKQMKNSNV